MLSSRSAARRLPRSLWSSRVQTAQPVEFRSRFTQAGSEVSDLLGRMRSLSFGPKIKTREDLANRIRSTLANVLGQIGDERALPALEKLSEKSDDSEVRFYSRQAISMLGARRYRGY